jgi:hypothetical protein
LGLAAAFSSAIHYDLRRSFEAKYAGLIVGKSLDDLLVEDWRKTNSFYHCRQL